MLLKSESIGTQRVQGTTVEGSGTVSGKPLLVTSVPPSASIDGERSRVTRTVLKSFEANGYEILALRRQGEDKPLHLDSLRHAFGTDEGFFPRRYGPSFSDIFSLGAHKPVEAIVNSDCYMVPCDVADELRAREQTVICTRRIDVESLGGAFEGVYGRGIDGLFFSPDIDLTVFEPEDFGKFQLGAPFWDVVVPIMMSFHFNLVFLTPPILLHAHHEQNWRKDDYDQLRMHAMRVVVAYATKVEAQSQAAARFLAGLKIYCPMSGPDAEVTQKQAKRAATYMVSYTEALEEANGIAVATDLNDEYMRACLNSMVSADRDHVNAARQMARYRSSGYGPVRTAAFVVRTLLRVRRITRRRARLRHVVLHAMPAVDRPLREAIDDGGLPGVRIRLKHDLWNPDQYSPRPISLGNSYTPRALPVAPAAIAIVTPSFNHVHFLGQTVESVLSQGVEGVRYHVQDGGSSDGTVDFLRGLDAPMSYESKPDKGQSHAINLGFEQVEGDVMAYLNSDDILLPGSLAYVDDFFRRNPEVDFIYGHRIYIDEAGHETGRAVLPHHDGEALKWADYVPQETMFWRRRVWDKVGPFDDSMQFAMDWDFLLRAGEAGFRFARVPRFLAAFRVHAAQKTSSMIMSAGEREMKLLRRRSLGFHPTQRDIAEAIRPYLNRQAVYSRLNRIGILRY